MKVPGGRREIGEKISDFVCASASGVIEISSVFKIFILCGVNYLRFGVALG